MFWLIKCLNYLFVNVLLILVGVEIKLKNMYYKILIVFIYILELNKIFKEDDGISFGVFVIFFMIEEILLELINEKRGICIRIFIY